MAALTPADAVLSVGQRIGRYFTLVSMIPAMLLVLWAYMLIGSGTLSGTPSLRNVAATLSHWSVGKVIGVLLASLSVALVLHPLQFATTQLLEGYWGTTPLARTAMNLRILHHRKRQRSLTTQAADNAERQRDFQRKEIAKHPEWLADKKALKVRKKNFTRIELGDPMMRYVTAAQEALRLRARDYPEDAARIMPTRLGNALRRFEDTAGSQYGLRALTISTHLHLIAPPRHLDYLVDARQAMDSAIRICTVGLIAAVMTVGLLLTHGWWLLWTLVPYSVSYLAYQGAVSAAQGYGTIVSSVIDLDRFLLYQEFGLDRPLDNAGEKLSNEKLMKMLDGDKAVVRYRQETPLPGGPQSTSAADGNRRVGNLPPVSVTIARGNRRARSAVVGVLEVEAEADIPLRTLVPWAGMPPTSLSIRARCSMFHVMNVMLR